MATIYGAPEACGVAANRILDIIRKEERDDDLPLKLLAHNALIGRLIGRDGRNLKQIQVLKLKSSDENFFRRKLGRKLQSARCTTSLPIIWIVQYQFQAVSKK